MLFAMLLAGSSLYGGAAFALDVGAKAPNFALLSTTGKRLSELLAPLRQKYFISGEINSEVDDSAARIVEIEQHYAAQGAKIGYLDGVSVDFDDWHFNVRRSNTEPLLRLCLESLVSQDDMEFRRDEVLALIRQ